MPPATGDVAAAGGADGRRRQIADAAVGVFAANGFGGASMREIAAAAGLEKGHLTYYFPVKVDILFEVVADLHQRFTDGFASWASGFDRSTPALRNVLVNHTRTICERHLQARVAYENLRFLSGDRLRAMRDLRVDYEHRLGELIDACRAETAIADVSTSLLTKMLLGLANWPYQWFDPAGPISADDIAAVYADRAVAALRTQ